MEMVQFHPTGLLGGPDTRMTGTVLEEGLRGAGGYLLNGDGERFMANYDKRGERATRDVVSRGIYAEMRAGRTGPMGGVYIQMSHLGPEKVAKTFPGMVNRCKDCGFDLAGGKVEVVPTAHHLMGGVEFNVDGSTASPGCTRRARTVAACMAPTGSAAMAWRIPPCSAASPAIRWPRTWPRTAAGAIRIRAPRARHRARGISLSKPAGRIHELRDQLARTMGRRRRAAPARRDGAAWRPWPPHHAAAASARADGDRRLQPDLARLAQPGKPGRYLQGHHRVGAGAREQPWRALPEDFRAICTPAAATRASAPGGDLRLDMVPVSFDIVQPGQSLIDGEAGTPQA